MRKQAAFKVKGMQRDLSVSSFNPEFAYENMNMRLITSDSNSLMSLINEKGTKECNIKGIDAIQGTVIGTEVLDDNLILFVSGDKESTNLQNTETSNTTKDKIYKIWFNEGAVEGKLLYEGNLLFNCKYPIETIPIYENTDVKKVYWVDGINQPRFINIEESLEKISKWNDNSFDFVSKLKLRETVTITKNSTSSGIFASGVIQYAFTYYNKYAQETNIFYTSPLYYVSYHDRGASPEDKVNNSFDITINNIDRNFDYIRIYSILRTSINSVPSVKRVIDIAINNDTVTYTDNGETGDSIDPTELFYLGGEEIIAGTIAHKDNVLFLGNIKLERKEIDSDIKKYFKDNNNINFVIDIKNTNFKKLDSPEPKNYYVYNNQLKDNSQKIKTFKYLEWYRFGIQFQHYTGKWSEPIFIKDAQCKTHISTTFYEDDQVFLPRAQYLFNDTSIIEKLYNQGYVKARPVIVYPTLNDRECICQGVLCPTVYNVGDRYSNSPFVQSSWFIRPNAPFDIYNTEHFKQDSSTLEWSKDWRHLSGYPASSEPSKYSKAGILSSNNYTINYNNKDYYIDVVNKGAMAEFRHNWPIPSNNKSNAEIQCIYNPPESPYIESSSTDSDIAEWVSNNSENFYIDQSIVTLHSPDIEFNDDIKNFDTSNLKLRIVGIVPITSFYGDIDISTSTPVNNFKDFDDDFPLGFYKEPIGVENDFSYELSTTYIGDSHFGWKSLLSGAFWFDECSYYSKGTSMNKKVTKGFVVYPWHRNGSLNNTKYATDGYRSAMLDKKRLSNTRFSYKTIYFNSDSIWNAYIEDNNSHTGISGAVLFDSNETTLIKIPSPSNSNLQDFNYYGNIDKVLNISRVGDKKDGYPIVISGGAILDESEFSNHKLFTYSYKKLSDFSTFSLDSKGYTGIDSVRMKYKSTPHIVVAFNYTQDKHQVILPTLYEGDTIGSNKGKIAINKQHYLLDSEKMFWDKKNGEQGIYQDVIDTSLFKGPLSSIYGPQHGWLWLGELYNDNVINRFGGETEEALENNQWLPCGESVSLITEDNNLKKSIVLNYTEGDTYYQRYDFIKTYPYSLEDQNQVTDILSFMCETRVNLDGRYDRNRGQLSNFAITPENFNKINDVYSQSNNLFSYRTSNSNKLSIDNYPNTITWSKEKTLGELTDTWTNITLASTLDLDGDKGELRDIRRLNNDLLAFQDYGISQIMYNDNMQLTTTEGVPIEIANNGKVNGKRYLTDKVGCKNKWSICETLNGIYFVDDNTQNIYLFNGKLNNLSSQLGFHSWISNNSDSLHIWNPVDFNNIVTYYDKNNGDVMFITENECLNYSETLGQFTSFYSYNNTPYFVNIKDKGVWIKDNKLWLHNEGNYNIFFNEYKPFYTTIIVNPDMQLDKIYDNLEFRSDSWVYDNVNRKYNLSSDTFDTLSTWNEYQSGSVKLVNTLNKPSSLKRKFRIWRANIPRDSKTRKDRMRNPWLYLKLSKEETNTNKTILHDLMVYYFE